MMGSERVRKYFNRKIILGVSSLFICIALICICSFVPFIIDPSQWQTVEFLTDELIIVAIVIFAMISTIFIGQASNAQNENSNLAKSRVLFFETSSKIVNIKKEVTIYEKKKNCKRHACSGNGGNLIRGLWKKWRKW